MTEDFFNGGSMSPDVMRDIHNMLTSRGVKNSEAEEVKYEYQQRLHLAELQYTEEVTKLKERIKHLEFQVKVLSTPLNLHEEG